MESMRNIRIRLKSIDSTMQITESMRLISTRKVQKLRGRMEENRPYLKQSVKIIDDIINDYYLKEHAYITERGDEKALIILITGDRGLCGGYNVNASKEAHALMKKFGDTQFVTVGTKGRDYLKRRQKNIFQSFKGMSENPFYEDAQSIGDIALKMFDDRTVDQVYLVYTEHISMLSQTPKSVRLLPLTRSGSEETDSIKEYDSDKEIFFNYAVATYIYSVIFGAMLESAVAEQCSRVTGMDSAVKNSKKIIDTLTLQYNQMRQGAITQEIAEIVGGANIVRE